MLHSNLMRCQFEFPLLGTEDVISMTVNFVAQETTANKGGGGEVTIFAKKITS